MTLGSARLFNAVAVIACHSGSDWGRRDIGQPSFSPPAKASPKN
jgi:hypothetical protein